MFQFQRPTYRIGFSLSSRERDPIAEAANHTKVMRGSRFVNGLNRARKPNIDTRRKFCLRRQNANHIETSIGKTKSGSFQVGSSLQHPFPKTVADHCNRIFLRRKKTANDWGNAEDTKKIWRNR